MNIFQEVKDSVDIVDVAKRYGVDVVRNRMAHCPFHQDKHPSMSFYRDGHGDEKFTCFSGACNARGDVIDLVSRLENLSLRDAAQELNDVYHLNIDMAKPIDRTKQRRKQAIRNREESLRVWEQDTYFILIAYEELLKEWKKLYVPLHPTLPVSPRYVEASGSRRDHIDYLLNLMDEHRGDLRMMAKFYMTHRQFIDDLRCRLEEEQLPYAHRFKKHPVPAGDHRSVYLPDHNIAVEAL